MNLQNNKLIVKGAASGGTASLGSWNGTTGIITTQSDAQTAQSYLTTLAVATADDIGRVGQTFGGQTVATGDVLVMYTYAGDANLSGRINADDYFQIDSSMNKPSSLVSYFHGDFNYDGKINGDDYFLIDSNFSRQGAAFSTGALPEGISIVPEPTAAALLTVAATMALRRRRL